MNILTHLKELFRLTLSEYTSNVEEYVSMIKRSNRPGLDYQADFCMKLGKELNRPPLELAQEITDKIWKTTNGYLPHVTLKRSPERQTTMKDKPNETIQETLDWCNKNEVLFKITDHGGRLAVAAVCDTISAEYFIPPPYTHATLGHTVYTALLTIMSGTKFHATHGPFPEATRGDTPTGSEADATANPDSGG